MKTSSTPRPTPDSEAWKTIVGAIGCLPEFSAERIAAANAILRLEETVNRKTRILNLCQEAISQLRLDMKYLIFDLECTRDERDELREEKGK